MKLTDAARRAQADALGRLLAGGTLKVLGGARETLLAAKLSKDYVISPTGDRVVLPPPAEAEVQEKGHATYMQLWSADGVLLAEDLAGDHQGAVVKFEDPQLWTKMLVSFDEDLIIELKVPKETI